MTEPHLEDEPLRLDSEAMRALAHPLRARLLTQLRSRGEATATRLAADLGTNSGATSYHLRRLAAIGLVEDAGTGTGRERVWRPAVRGHELRAGDIAGDADAETALAWLTRDYVRYLGEKVERWIDVESTWPREWREAMPIANDSVVVSADQAAAMFAELNEVVARYRRVGQGNPSARRVAVWSLGYPIDLQTPPRGTYAG